MTFLQLCARLRSETSYADAGPTAVTAQVGAHLRCVQWISEAYIELQNRTRWRWLRRTFTFDTVADTASYAYTAVTDVDTTAAISRFRAWQITNNRNPAKVYLQSAGIGTQGYLPYMPWESFRVVYQIGSPATGAPAHITIDPNDKLVIGPTPDDIYVVTGEFDRSAQVLAADGDTPELHSDYHLLIVYLAMEDFALFEAAEEVLTRARVKSRKLLRQLESTQMQKFKTAGPMA